MSRVPDETSSWSEAPDPEVTAREMREQLDIAKARMKEHREQMRAAGLTGKTPAEAPKP
ncbi:MAG: hypothetical protein ACJ798_10775 [Phenylobacterium sp.]